ncbi:MAG: hypothetical protein DKT66_28030 [Candidatus Melainabacteria bacterium]|jgi:hypothetical protein|nr:MAG: hypothetical protein DKT66_28030 [Candidatus Melainabacteria bacterium]
MPRKKIYTDIHIRVEKSRLAHIDRMLKRDQTRTDFIRSAIDRQIENKADELASPYYGQVLNYVRTFEEELCRMLVLCWRAAAESIAVDMEVYRLTSADQVPPEVLEGIRARAKKESEEWAKHVKDGLAVDLAKLKRDPAKAKQMFFDGVDVPSAKPKGKPKAKKVKKSP